jgi:nucleoid DNA-binding protein
VRTAVDYRSSSKDNYVSFKKAYPDVKISFDAWKNILYTFNEEFKTYILETGDKAKLQGGIGEFSINKKKRKQIKTDPRTGKEFINLPIDWKRTNEKKKESGKWKIIYNFNYHTEGFYFGWMWFKSTARFRNSDLWYFKPTRVTSRLLSHYIKTDNKYQHIYKEWIF